MEQDLKTFTKNTIYPYDQSFDQVYKAIQRDLSSDNSLLLQKYDHEMVNQSLSKATRLKHLKVMLSLSRMIKKDWKDVTKEDIDGLVYRIMQTYASDTGRETESSRDFKKVLKIFFRWFKLGSRSFDEVGDPVETKKIKLKQVESKVIREDLITESDRTAILNACEENARDRALIDCHHEAGTRPGEILSLKIKHVKFDDFGAVIMVDGKTGARPVRLIRSTPNLSAWIDKHPFRDNPEAPLWIMFEKKVYGQAMTYSAARKMINKRCMKADLPKRIYLNLFRHSEATESAKFLNETHMRKRHGWRPGSKMPERYTHLINADVDRAILEHHGLTPKSDDVKARLPKMCHICKMPNATDSKLCNKCGKPLDLESALEIEEKQKEKEQSLMDELSRQRQAIEYLLKKDPEASKLGF